MISPRIRSSVRFAAVGITAASLLSVPPGATASASPANEAAAETVLAAARYDTSIRFLDFDHTRRVGTTTTIRGQVTAKVGGSWGAVQGVRVRLYRKFAGTSTWQRLGGDYTSRQARPKFVFRARSKANAAYRVVFGGNKRLQSSRDITSVSVYRRIDARLQDGTGRFHGRVTPHYGHQKVSLQKRSCGTCSWRTVRNQRTSSRGRFSFTVGAPRTGRYFWRASTPATKKFIRSYSGVFSTYRG